MSLLYELLGEGEGRGYGRRCAFILIRKSIGRSVGVIGLKGGDALILDSVEFCERENQWLARLKDSIVF